MTFPPVSYPPLPHHIAAHAEERPDHPAIVEGDRTISYAELYDLMRRGAATLRGKGIGKGDRVLVAGFNKTDLILCILAAMAVGAPVMPVSFAEEDIASVARYFEPKIILLQSDHPQSQHIATDFASLPISTLSDANAGDIASLTYDDIGLLILTSGTTQGHRRGTLLSHRALSGSAEYMNHRLGIDDTVRDLVTSPLEHGFGMGRVRCTLHAGGTVVVQSVLFSPAVVVEGLAAHKCNMLSAPVVTVGMLLENERDGLLALSDQIRWIELGSSHLKPAHRRTLFEILPHTRCFISYGLTEAIRCTFLEINDAGPKIDSVGKPTSWTRVRIVDDEDNPVPPGQEGHIQVDGVNKASGYYGYPEAWTEKQSGPWLYSGDIGTMDEDGFLTFVGRDDDMINVGGLKVAPEEVETELAALLSGTTYSVAQIPDPVGIEGAVPGLFFETEGAAPVDLGVVREHLRKRLPEFKIPRSIYALPRFPRTETTNKIRRAGLTDAARIADRAALPKTRCLMAQIGDATQGGWPAFAGDASISFKRLADLLHGDGRPAEKRRLLADMLEWMRSAAKTDDAELGRAIQQSQSIYEASGSIGVGVSMAWPPIVQAIVTRALVANWACVLYRPREQMLVAEDLGWLRKHRLSDLVIDAERFERYADAEDHLHDAFDSPSFKNLFVVGAAPKSDALARFHRNFEFPPHHLVPMRGSWAVRKLHPPPDGNAADGSRWKILCEVAAEIFEIPADSLSFNSSAETTPGWNSLGFVSLIMAVETRFGVELSAKDIMSVRRLGDLETRVAEKT